MNEEREKCTAKEKVQIRVRVIREYNRFKVFVKPKMEGAHAFYS